MGIINSETNEELVKLNKTELEEKAKQMRAYELIALNAAGSGHSGGSLSITDITTALYFNIAKHDPKNPDWEARDRIIFSAGHKAPAQYAALGMAGYFPIEELMKLRKFGSNLQGHPHALKLKGLEVSTGSLGQGLSDAVGIALAGKIKKQDYKVFCIMGDGEQQEGQIWEAAMQASNHNLDNLIAIVDKNKLQIDGRVKEVSNIDPLDKKYESFGWNVLMMDGHNIEDILSTLGKAYTQNNGKPTVIIADTIKGKGVSFMEDMAGWHGKAPNKEELKKALKELGVDLDVAVLQRIAKDYQETANDKMKELSPEYGEGDKYSWKTEGDLMVIEKEKTRAGFGKAIAEMGREDGRIIPLGADISGSINIADFYKKNPELKDRFKSMGIAEQSIAGVAAGLAKEGLLPVFGTYGVFSAGRALDQIRMFVYDRANVLILGAHAGVSVGPDGATHQALEDLFAMCGLPGMNVAVPCDAEETKKAAKYLLQELKGPKYLRYARESTPIVTKEDTPYIFGKANVIKYIWAQKRFIDAFETVLAQEYENKNDDIAIIAAGPIVAEAMRAAWILKEEFGYETRVINMHTLKPLDEEAIIKAAQETKCIITAEEHQIGGLGNQVATTILKAGYNPRFGMIGVKDRFGESGSPDELAIAFELRAGNIVEKIKQLYGGKR